MVRVFCPSTSKSTTRSVVLFCLQVCFTVRITSTNWIFLKKNCQNFLIAIFRVYNKDERRRCPVGLVCWHMIQCFYASVTISNFPMYRWKVRKSCSGILHEGIELNRLMWRFQSLTELARERRRLVCRSFCCKKDHFERRDFYTEPPKHDPLGSVDADADSHQGLWCDHGFR